MSVYCPMNLPAPKCPPGNANTQVELEESPRRRPAALSAQTRPLAARQSSSSARIRSRTAATMSAGRGPQPRCGGRASAPDLLGEHRTRNRDTVGQRR